MAILFRWIPTDLRQLDARLSREYEGMGMGLALVKRIAEMHPGGVAVERAEIGQGRHFGVTLPWPPLD